MRKPLVLVLAGLFAIVLISLLCLAYSISTAKEPNLVVVFFGIFAAMVIAITGIALAFNALSLSMKLRIKTLAIRALFILGVFAALSSVPSYMYVKHLQSQVEMKKSEMIERIAEKKQWVENTVDESNEEVIEGYVEKR